MAIRIEIQIVAIRIANASRSIFGGHRPPLQKNPRNSRLILCGFDSFAPAYLPPTRGGWTIYPPASPLVVFLIHLLGLIRALPLALRFPSGFAVYQRRPRSPCS